MWQRQQCMTRSPILRAAGLVAALALVASACGDDSPAASDATGAPVLAIDGATYLSQSVTGYTLADGSRLTLFFDGEQISANAGCNSMAGSFSVEDGTLVVGQLASTEMFCDGLMDQESWFAEFLTSKPTITQDGDTLTLVSGDVTLEMLDREIADPDRPLEGTTWIIDSVITNDAVSTGMVTGSITLADGTASIDTGCNTGSGTYELVDGGLGITFGPIALTKKACEKDDAGLEAQFVTVLDGTVTVTIEAASITLMNGDNGLGGRAEA